MWGVVEDFLASASSQQDVIASILSGVIHKYILRASELDLHIPEMLLRECEEELLKVTVYAYTNIYCTVCHLWEFMSGQRARYSLNSNKLGMILMVSLYFYSSCLGSN